MKRTKSIMILFYVAVGIGSACISFIFERSLIMMLLGDPTIATLLTVVLEGGKLLTLLVYGFLRHGNNISAFLSVIVRSTYSMLVIFSILASTFRISVKLDRPYLDEVRSEKIEDVKSAHQEKINKIETLAEQKKATLNSELEKDKNRLNQKLSTWQKRVREVDLELMREGKNVVDGISTGPRWDALNKQKTNAEEALRGAEKQLDIELRELRAEHESTLTTLDKKTQDAINSADNTKKEKITALQQNGFENDPTVHNKVFFSALRTLNHSIFQHIGFKLKVLDTIFFLSLLLAFVLESIIYTSINAAIKVFSNTFTGSPPAFGLEDEINIVSQLSEGSQPAYSHYLKSIIDSEMAWLKARNKLAVGSMASAFEAEKDLMIANAVSNLKNRVLKSKLTKNVRSDLGAYIDNLILSGKELKNES